LRLRYEGHQQPPSWYWAVRNSDPQPILRWKCRNVDS
jgi:hypothetical protein